MTAFIERHQGGDRAVLVVVEFPQHQQTNALAEFEELAMSSGAEPVWVQFSKRDRPDPKYFIGKGKAEELAENVKALQADLILINHAISPGQGRNLEQLCQCRVVDRTELILDIFAQRARSYEGKLQVELAQLQHLSTRLVRGWTHLERQKGGIGLRGPGETQLETDRRLVGQRIKFIKKRLDNVRKQRHQSRKSRKKNEALTISLVGYTNAGKSTLFNQLTASDVYAQDQLFATLDPTVRALELPGLGQAVLVDTVGFVQDLPHELVAAFQATLEETTNADLLLHVVDCADPHYRDNIFHVNQVLADIQADRVPQLQIYNKIDLREGAEPHIDYDQEHLPWRVWLSAQQGSGMELVTRAMEKRLASDIINKEIMLDSTEGRLRAELYRLQAVTSEQIDELGRWHITIRMPAQDYQRLLKREGKRDD